MSEERLCIDCGDRIYTDSYERCYACFNLWLGLIEQQNEILLKAVEHYSSRSGNWKRTSFADLGVYRLWAGDDINGFEKADGALKEVEGKG